ncbi:hypothetical protein R0137_12215 [Congregibacter brevis]|uniref:Uncharacterized protein n=1 Tax=Congregibacter brevis TaxID=3081201 RepID=A0ABZ0IAB5_9GAMM|nr:hypothetical protein R0137_12215 [Congregibacter sp. IMCC45268]
MIPLRPLKRLTWPASAWSATVVLGVAVPILVLLTLSGSPSSLVISSGPILTLGLMGVGIIAASTAGRFGLAVSLALMNGASLIVFALLLGMPAPTHPFSTVLAMVIATVSFSARGALFAITLSQRGWLMALFVVAGEASVLLIVSLFPGALPDWFLALLPAQWASIAIQASLSGAGTLAAIPVLIALAGTAVTTLLAARFCLHRWPYPLMFTVWLGLSALVYFWSAPATPNAGYGFALIYS